MPVDLSTFLLIAFGLAAMVSTDGARPNFSRSDYLALSLFATAAGIATLFSDDPARSSRYLVYLLINIFLLLLVASLRDVRHVRVILGCLAVLGLAHLAAVLIPGLMPGLLSEPVSPEAIIAFQPLVTLLVPNDALIFGLCLPAMVIVLWMTGKKRKPSSLLTLLAFTLLAFYASYLLQSKVALVSVLVALTTLTAGWLSRTYSVSGAGRFLIPASAILATLLLFSFAWYMGNQSTTRLGLWSHAVSDKSASAILLGSGPNTFSYDPLTTETLFDEDGRVIPWTHNLFLEAYAEQGLLGLAAVLTISIIPIRRALNIDDPAMRAFLFSCAATFFLLGMLEITLTRRFYFAFLALVYGLSCAPALRR